jgi:hypothetical protein
MFAHMNIILTCAFFLIIHKNVAIVQHLFLKWADCALIGLKKASGDADFPASPLAS